MITSNLAEALNYKSKELQFYPVMYVDDLAGIETTKKVFGKYISGLILASIFYHYISNLEQLLISFSKLYNQSLKYIVYPVKGTAKSPLPSDQLIMATLSILTRLGVRIIIYVKTDRQVIQDYLHNRNNAVYMSKIALMEQLQAKDEMLKYRRHIVVCNICLYGK